MIGAVIQHHEMDPRFSGIISSLHSALERLLAMAPMTTGTLPLRMPSSGVYLFSEGNRHLYVGRSNRLRSRIRRHGVETAKHNVAAFAFRLAREATGRTEATYKTEGSRRQLVQDPEFARAFLEAKARIRSMAVRYVEETDQLRQALLEIYAAVALETPYNDFDTH